MVKKTKTKEVRTICTIAEDLQRLYGEGDLTLIGNIYLGMLLSIKDITDNHYAEATQDIIIKFLDSSSDIKTAKITKLRKELQSHIIN